MSFVLRHFPAVEFGIARDSTISTALMTFGSNTVSFSLSSSSASLFLPIFLQVDEVEGLGGSGKGGREGVNGAQVFQTDFFLFLLDGKYWECFSWNQISTVDDFRMHGIGSEVDGICDVIVGAIFWRNFCFLRSKFVENWFDELEI